MASYLLPSSLQKRLLRYALSRLELLDTDALDLERLDIAWGKRSTVELRDVRLRLQKLSKIMHLPQNVEIKKANILLLRVTIPADLYSSPIVIVVDGVETQLEVQLGDITRKTGSRSSPKTSQGTQDDLEIAEQYMLSKPDRRQHRRSNSNADIHLDSDRLPNTVDLAASFLQDEPEDEKAKLTEALSQQVRSHQEAELDSSEDEDSETNAGTGTGLSLPGFVAGFLRGVGERLQVKIKGFEVNINCELRSDASSEGAASPKVDLITLQLKVDNVEVEGFMKEDFDHEQSTAPSDSPQGLASTAPSVDSKTKTKGKRRRIRFRDIRALVISESSLFSSLTRTPARASSIAEPSLAEESHGYRNAYENPSDREHPLKGSDRFQSSSSKDGSALYTSSSPLASPIAGSQDLSASVSASDVVRFADASDDEEIEEGDPSESLRVVSSGPTLITAPTRSSRLQSDHKLDYNAPIYLAQEEDPSRTLRSSRVSSEDMVTTDELSESKIFSHEEAESIYMSALSIGRTSVHEEINTEHLWRNEESAHGTSSPVKRRPAGDGRKAYMPSTDEPTPGNVQSSTRYSASLQNPDPPGQPADLSQAQTTRRASSSDSDYSKEQSGAATPTRRRHEKASSPSGASQTFPRVAKEILSVDEIILQIPSTDSDATDTPYENVALQEGFKNATSSSLGFQPTGSAYQTMPGAFSAYASQQRNLRESGNFPSHGGPRPTTGNSSALNFSSIDSTSASPTATEGPIQVNIGTTRVQFDGSIALLLTRILTQGILPVNESSGSSNPKEEPRALTITASTTSVEFVEKLHCAELPLDPLPGPITFEKSSDLEVLLRARVTNMSLERTKAEYSCKTNISMRKLHLGYANGDILKFEAGENSRTEKGAQVSREPEDISITITQTPMSRRLSIMTLPVHVFLDIQKLDDTFSWVGGFSSIIGLGSSLTSSTTALKAGRDSSIPDRPRGVHFASPGTQNDAAQTTRLESKADARISGITIEILGKRCTARMETSALKLVSRGEGIGAQLDQIKFSGPHILPYNSSTAFTVTAENTRLEYLPAPKETDLARLLGLLTPSRNKFEQDEDILVDTLLRQRRQGSVLRMNIMRLQGDVKTLDDILYLSDLGAELTRLSSVAKYLPQDDRPGILSLLNIREAHFDIDINDHVGHLQVLAGNVHAAYVNLPSLFALAVQTLQICRNEGQEMLGEASRAPDDGVDEPTPMIMARMIGDEMDPTLKLQLFKLRIEYSVQTLLEMLGRSSGVSTEQVVADIIETVGSLQGGPMTELTQSGALKQFPPDMASSVLRARPWKLDAVLRDCIFGLSPLKSPSRALLVVTEAHLTCQMPVTEAVEASVDVKKASFLIIDDVKNLVRLDEVPTSSKRKSRDFGSSQVNDLCATGYISVSFISSASFVIHLDDMAGQGGMSVDLDVRDDLLVIESCADSTQTLLTILNGLAPPSLPSYDIKYRTEVIPVQDMLASFTGDAFGPRKRYEPPFEDVEEGAEEQSVEGSEEGEAPLEESYSSEYENSGDEEEYGGSLFSTDQNPMLEGTLENVAESDFDNISEPESSIYTKESGTESTLQQEVPTREPDLLESLHDRQNVFTDGPLDFHEDHFGREPAIEGSAHRWDSVNNTYSSVNEYNILGSPLKVRVRDVHIIWNLFDGYDWGRTRDVISKAVQDVEQKATERRARNERNALTESDDDDDSVIGDFLFNSIYIGIPANRDPKELTRQINQDVDDLASETGSHAPSTISRTVSQQSHPVRGKGKRLRLNRSKHHKVTFELKGIALDLVIFPPGSGETQSSLDVRVRDFDIVDHVPTSTWRKFATYMHDAGDRESGSNMIHLELLNVRPIPDLAASEIVLKATLLPLRLHVDQDALDFVTRFFEFHDSERALDAPKSDVPFLQRVEVNSIRVKLDYKPKKVDYAGLRSGHTTEFMNFFILDQADLILRHVIIYGISGFDKLSRTLNDIWMPDIKGTQLPGVLAGIAPVRSLANMGGGVRDLVVVPMREYRKDGRVVRSIQKGAVAFARTTTSELVKLGAKLAIGTQTALQGAEGFLKKPSQEAENAWEEADLDEDGHKQISLYADQPLGVMQGVRGAFASLERDLLTARDAIVAVPGEMFESGSAGGAARAVLRRAPTIIFRPAIGASKAVSQTLMGATNSLDPEHRRRIDEKYKKN